MKSSKPKRSPVHLLHRAKQRCDELFSLRVEGTTPRQLAVLIAINENQGINQSLVTARTGIDRSTLAEIISRLIRKRLLRRVRSHKDARNKLLSLTDEGRRLLREGEPVARHVDTYSQSVTRGTAQAFLGNAVHHCREAGARTGWLAF